MTRIVLLGPPGVGKGTQAAALSRLLGVPAISTGDIFRDNVNRETALGRAARSYMDAGEYVPDEITNNMVAARLSADDASRGFILDGYPRTVAQVDELDRILASRSCVIDRVLALDAPQDALLERLTVRAAHQGRADDTPDVIKRRLSVYAEQTAPIIEIYKRHNLLGTVDSTGDVESVTALLIQALQAQTSRAVAV